MDALGINLSGLITQVVSFLILFVVLYSLLYRPLLRVIDRRSQRIKESLEQASMAKEEAARSKADMESQIGAARAEGQAMIVQAREVADRFREEGLAKARQDIEVERARAQASIQRERDSVVDELRRGFAGLVMDAAENVVGRSLDERLHRDLIQKALEESSNINQK